MKKTVSRTSVKHIFARRDSKLELHWPIIALSLVILFASAPFSQAAGSGATAGQAGTGVNPKTLTPIDALHTNPRNPSTYQLSFDKIEKYEARFAISGDGKTWRVVRFQQIPAGVTIRLDGRPEGYAEIDKVLSEKEWYPFKLKLTLFISIPQDVPLPVDIVYQLSFIKEPVGGLDNLEKAISHVGREANVEPPQPLLQIIFKNADPALNQSPSPSPSVSPSTETTSGGVESYFPLWMWIGIIVGVVLIIVFIVMAIKNKRSRGYGRFHPRSGQSKRTKQIYDPSNRVGILSRLRARLSGKVKQESREEVKQELSVDGIFGDEPSAPPATKSAPYLGIVAESTSSFGAQQPTKPPAASTDIQNLNRELDDRLEKLRIDLEKLQNTVFTQKQMLDARNTNDAALRTLRGEVQMLETQQRTLAKEFEGKLAEIERRRVEQEEKINQAQKSAENALEYMQAQVRQFEESTERQKAEFEKQEKQQSDTYSHLLGGVLGISVEVLREGNYDALVEEANKNLDRFFQEWNGRADGLPELQEKAEAISTGLEAMAGRARTMKPEMEKLRPYVERAKKLATGLAQANAQLTGRQPNLQLTLSLPLEVSPGARGRFLEELGKAVKKEIDKLRDPLQYWGDELERLAKSDILAVTDICDIDLTGGPGADMELEQHLGALFRQAELRPIVPKPGADFKPAEQNLIAMFPGSSAADSQKIKKVKVRGFYYHGNGKEQLLRKASVEVYR